MPNPNGLTHDQVEEIVDLKIATKMLPALMDGLSKNAQSYAKSHEQLLEGVAVYRNEILSGANAMVEANQHNQEQLRQAHETYMHLLEKYQSVTHDVESNTERIHRVEEDLLSAEEMHNNRFVPMLKTISQQELNLKSMQSRFDNAFKELNEHLNALEKQLSDIQNDVNKRLDNMDNRIATMHGEVTETRMLVGRS